VSRADRSLRIAPAPGRQVRKFRSPGYHWVAPKSRGITVARLIVLGDMSGAHKVARGQRHWSVVEARAILGALAAARVWWPYVVTTSETFGL
jgi:hypothetical protein